MLAFVGFFGPVSPLLNGARNGIAPSAIPDSKPSFESCSEQEVSSANYLDTMNNGMNSVTYLPYFPLKLNRYTSIFPPRS
jgi:hypothetical protein